MKNLAIAGTGLILVLIGVFFFSKAKSSNDIIIPSPIPVESPKPSFTTQSQNSRESSKNAMTLPFQLLKKEEIAGKRTLVGDVDFEAVKDIVSAISPVPGGVGAMTVASLFENLVEAFKRQNTA